jgi:hypothetical protein
MHGADNYKETLINHRRKVLLSGAALLSICFSAPVGLASGDGGGGDGGERSQQKNNAGKKPTVQMSQTKFRSLSNRETYRLSDRNFTGKIIFKLDGFSVNMSSRILSMASFETGSTRRLLKDMSKLKTRKARKNRLTEEIDRMTKLKKLLEDSQKRLKAKTGEHARRAAGEEWARWVNVKAYLEHLRVWRRFPNEGILK